MSCPRLLSVSSPCAEIFPDSDQQATDYPSVFRMHQSCRCVRCASGTKHSSRRVLKYRGQYVPSFHCTPLTSAWTHCAEPDIESTMQFEYWSENMTARITTQSLGLISRAFGAVNLDKRIDAQQESSFAYSRQHFDLARQKSGKKIVQVALMR
jgi:hypothetical protein